MTATTKKYGRRNTGRGNIGTTDEVNVGKDEKERMNDKKDVRNNKMNLRNNKIRT